MAPTPTVVSKEDILKCILEARAKNMAVDNLQEDTWLKCRTTTDSPACELTQYAEDDILHLSMLIFDSMLEKVYANPDEAEPQLRMALIYAQLLLADRMDMMVASKFGGKALPGEIGNFFTLKESHPDTIPNEMQCELARCGVTVHYRKTGKLH